MKFISYLILILIFNFSVLSQSIQEDQGVKDALNLVEKWIESQMSYDEIPGISMAIVYKDEIIWKYALGYSDLEKKTPLLLPPDFLQPLRIWQNLHYGKFACWKVIKLKS